jgi:triosephosphate isomerase
MRTPLVVGNWKMHGTQAMARDLAQTVRDGLKRPRGVEVVICPPFTALRSIETLIKSDRLPYGLGAQDVHWEEQGAFTGEVSPAMLEALEVGYVIVGHSERREHFGETDETVSRKVRAVLKHGITPILCVGETLQERDTGGTEDKVTGQVSRALQGVGAEHAAGIVVAYEPIWAIGTGRNAEPADAGQVIGLIRGTIERLYTSEVAGAVRIQYGGSVRPATSGTSWRTPRSTGPSSAARAWTRRSSRSS